MKFSRILSAAMAAVLLLPAMGSCGQNKMPEKQTLTHVYRATEIQYPKNDNTHVQDFKVEGDLIHFTLGVYDEETYEYTEKTYTVDLNGENLTETTPPKEDPATDPGEEGSKPAVEKNFYVVNEVALDDGTTWRAECHWSSDPITYEYKEEYIFLRTDAEGNELARFTGEDLWGTPDEDKYFYINRMLSVDAETLLLEGNNALYLVRDDGKNIRELSVEEYAENGYFENFFQSQGAFYFLYYEWKDTGASYSLIPLSVAEGKFGEPIPLSDLGDIYSSFVGDGSYTFYYMNQTAVYGYDVATGVSTELMNFLNSDINYSIAYGLHIISPDKFVTYGYDSLLQSQAIYILDRVPEEELVPKYILTLGVVGDDWSVRNEIIRFNRRSEEYRITLKTYEIEYPTEGEFDYNDLVSDVITKLNNDMIAGTGPDILLTNSYMPVDSYIAKGLFEDLYGYIDNDADLSRADFMPNFLSALEVNGGLYEAVPAFMVRTLAGTEIVGDRTKWTAQEFTNFVQSLPDGMTVFGEMTRDNALEQFISCGYEEYVNAETGECFFDSASFAQLLTFFATLPEELDENRYNDESYWQEHQNRFRENKVALETVYLSGFQNVASLMNYTFYTDQISFVGYPTEGENGGVLTPSDVSFAISAKSRLKDGAWDFVRYFLTAEYQDGLYSYFPLRKESLEKKMEDAVKEAEEQKARYEEQLKQQQEMEQNAGSYDDVITKDTAVPEIAVPHTESAETTAETEAAVETEAVADVEVEKIAVETDSIIQGGIAVMPEYPVMRETQYFLTREMAQTVYDYVASLDRVMRQNTAVMNIIKEDAAAFFAGQKSVQEAVKLIQNRVSTYVAESR